MAAAGWPGSAFARYTGPQADSVARDSSATASWRWRWIGLKREKDGTGIAMP
jgi:hypothetical protein